MSLPLELTEFLNGNSYRSFPIRETATKTSIDGILSIPSSFLVDLLCTVDSDITRRYYISTITVSPTSVVVEISTSSVVVGSFTVIPSNNLNQVVYLAPTAAYPGANGVLTVGTTADIIAGPNGSYTFNLAGAELEARCFIPGVVGVNRIVFKDALGNTFAVTGDVVLQAGLNLRYEIVNPTTVRLNAGEGLGLNETCASSAPPITTINGISPDENGNFIFDADGCATITAIQNGILLSSECAKPCLGCTEITELVSRVIVVENNLITLRNTYQALLSEYQALQQALTCAC